MVKHSTELVTATAHKQAQAHTIASTQHNECHDVAAQLKVKQAVSAQQQEHHKHNHPPQEHLYLVHRPQCAPRCHILAMVTISMQDHKTCNRKTPAAASTHHNECHDVAAGLKVSDGALACSHCHGAIQPPEAKVGLAQRHLKQVQHASPL
jgi:2-C-methyl-D-erythritol 4-phosphate cytidylyltransferase